MTPSRWNRSTLGFVLVLSCTGAFAPASRATNCYRYVSNDGTLTQIDMTCVEQLGVTPIFVREDVGGYDILVPQWSGASPQRSLLPAAATQWLSSAANLNLVASVIDFAESTSTVFPLTSSGGESKTEYLNYTLGSWLNTSGATTEIATIANDANNMNLGIGCAAWSICSSCERFACFVIGGVQTKCYCANDGFDCCVIHKTIQPVE
jgi:hypothetical protein